MDTPGRRELVWVGPTRKDIRALPQPVRRAFGLSLYAVQLGETPPDAKPLRGFGGAGILELIGDHRGSTFRAVYTVRFGERVYVLFGERVYVLHVFQRKSTRGIATPQRDIELIRQRLRTAELLHAAAMKEG